MACGWAFGHSPLVDAQTIPCEPESHFLRDLYHRDSSVTPDLLAKAAVLNPGLKSFSGLGWGEVVGRET